MEGGWGGKDDDDTDFFALVDRKGEEGACWVLKVCFEGGGELDTRIRQG